MPELGIIYPRMITGYYPCCPSCGARLEDYEIFACRIRGLDPPVCIGCMAQGLSDLKKAFKATLDRNQKGLDRLLKVAQGFFDAIVDWLAKIGEEA